jgi:hypothetical protein
MQGHRQQQGRQKKYTEGAPTAAKTLTTTWLTETASTVACYRVFTRITRNNRNAIKRRVGTATTVRLPVIIAGMFALAGTTESALGCNSKDAFEP